MLKKIKPEEIEADEVVGKLSDDDLRVFKRAGNKILATKSTIEHLNDGIGKQYIVVSGIWEKYDYPRDIRKALEKRGLSLCINNKTGDVFISKTDEAELRSALFHRLLW